MSANERRAAIIEKICLRRHDTVANLAQEFDVSIRTIKYDIETLALSYPVYTTQGNGGGVHVMDGYRIGRKYFKPSQKELLEKLSNSLQGDELKIMNEILNTFSKPTNIKNNGGI